jgi:hypothetical protein
LANNNRTVVVNECQIDEHHDGSGNGNGNGNGRGTGRGSGNGIGNGSGGDGVDVVTDGIEDDVGVACVGVVGVTFPEDNRRCLALAKRAICA